MGKRVLHDEYFRRAKAEGYVARSAYKLLEAHQRHPLLHKGDAALDLGCAPGSWLQVAARLVGPKGRVVGVDLQRVDRDVKAPNIRAEVGDVFAVGPDALLALNQGRRFDVVLSDMAPATSGAGPTDHFRSVELCRRVLALCDDVLRGGGNAITTF